MLGCEKDCGIDAEISFDEFIEVYRDDDQSSGQRAGEISDGGSTVADEPKSSLAVVD
jgi:hypothetical protein